MSTIMNDCELASRPVLLMKSWPFRTPQNPFYRKGWQSTETNFFEEENVFFLIFVASRKNIAFPKKKLTLRP